MTSNVLVPDSLTDLGAGACFNDARVEVVKLELSNRRDAATQDIFSTYDKNKTGQEETRRIL